MKKIILTLSLVICALLVIWGCTKSSNNNETTLKQKRQPQPQQPQKPKQQITTLQMLPTHLFRQMIWALTA